MLTYYLIYVTEYSTLSVNTPLNFPKTNGLLTVYLARIAGRTKDFSQNPKVFVHRDVSKSKIAVKKLQLSVSQGQVKISNIFRTRLITSVWYIEYLHAISIC